MNNSAIINHGIKLLVKKYRNGFQQPENWNHHNLKGYKKAEKKIIQLCLRGNSDH